MITLPIELLALAAEDFWDDVSFQLVGFFIVLITLAGLWIALEFIGSIFRSIDKKNGAAETAAPREDTAVTDWDPEIFAVVAAAVDTVICHPHEIVSITSHASQRSKSTLAAWSSEGRQDIYRSRRIR